jgi:hypothetical protein
MPHNPYDNRTGAALTESSMLALVREIGLSAGRPPVRPEVRIVPVWWLHLFFWLGAEAEDYGR